MLLLNKCVTQNDDVCVARCPTIININNATCKESSFFQTHFLTSQAAFSLIKLHIIAFNDRRKEAARRSLGWMSDTSLQSRSYLQINVDIHMQQRSINHLKRGDFYFYCISSFCRQRKDRYWSSKVTQYFPSLNHEWNSTLNPIVWPARQERKCRCCHYYFRPENLFSPSRFPVRPLPTFTHTKRLLLVERECSARREYPLLGLSA